MNEKYMIKRFYDVLGMKPRVIKKGLTLQEAQKHCNDPKTSGTRKDGVKWFDGYTKEVQA